MKLEVKWLFLNFCPQNLIKVSLQNRNYFIMCDTNMRCVKVWALFDLKATDDTLRKTFSPELGLFLQKLRPKMLCALQERSSSSTTFLLGWLSRSWRDIREWSGIGQWSLSLVSWLTLLVSLFSISPQLDRFIPVDCCLLAPLFFNPRATWSLSLIFCLLIEKFFMCLLIPRTTWSGTCRGTRTDRRSSRLLGTSPYLGKTAILLSR